MARSNEPTTFTETVTSRGRVTIPVEVRRHLGIHQGDQLEFDLAAPHVSLRVRRSPPPFSLWLGAAKGTFSGGQSEMNACIREMRGELVRDSD